MYAFEIMIQNYRMPDKFVIDEMMLHGVNNEQRIKLAPYSGNP